MGAGTGLINQDLTLTRLYIDSAEIYRRKTVAPANAVLFSDVLRVVKPTAFSVFTTNFPGASRFYRLHNKHDDAGR